jgi:acyl carrier protein
MSSKSEIKQFILGNYLFTNDESALADDDSLLQKGIVDSTGMLELIMHLEEKYGIKVAEDEMVPANLDSVVKITAFLERKLAK